MAASIGTAPLAAAAAPGAGAPGAGAPVAGAPGGAAAAIKGNLDGVAAASATSAWAVGSTTSGKSLMLHWDGTSWARVAIPGSGLSGVAATSATSAWAVGDSGRPGSGQPMILHWNGTSRARVPVSLPAGSQLEGVAAASPGDAWVVGHSGTRSPRTLILHWNGTSWKRVPSPDPHPFKNTGDALNGVAIVSARSVWAAGSVVSDFAGPGQGLILHWNGRNWKRTPASIASLTGVAAASAGSAMAVGCGCQGGVDGGVISHWNGHSWKREHNPVRAVGGALQAVAMSSARSAWAVGRYCKARCNTEAPLALSLILHWNGTAWRQSAHPSGKFDFLSGVAAASASSAWAVGQASNSRVLILHWDGHSWRAA